MRERPLHATGREHVGSIRALTSTSASASTPGLMKITEPYSPTIDPSAFSTKIDNPYFPLTPGTRTIYEAATPDGLQRTTTEVTRDTKKIMGVDTVVVHDTVTLDNEPLEDTFDWYAQDRDGNVWYFGEATKEFEDGTVDTEGSFEGGVDGALPGIIMPGHPQVGDQYRQEYAKGVAEDTGEVLSLTGSETTPLTGPDQGPIGHEGLRPTRSHRAGREQVLRPRRRADPSRANNRLRLNATKPPSSKSSDVTVLDGDHELSDAIDEPPREARGRAYPESFSARPDLRCVPARPLDRESSGADQESRHDHTEDESADVGEERDTTAAGVRQQAPKLPSKNRYRNQPPR